MAIAKNPKRRSGKLNADRAAEQFISAAGEHSSSEEREKLVQTPIRFSPILLRRIDAAARRRGLGRSSWIRYAASRVLDEDEATVG
jgi:hypothetical protein